MPYSIALNGENPERITVNVHHMWCRSCIICDAVHKKRHFNMQHICSKVMLFVASRGAIAPHMMQKMDKNLKKGLKNKVMQNSIIVMLG
jgi:hypothetical protein